MRGETASASRARKDKTSTRLPKQSHSQHINKIIFIAEDDDYPSSSAIYLCQILKTETPLTSHCKSTDYIPLFNLRKNAFHSSHKCSAIFARMDCILRTFETEILTS